MKNENCIFCKIIEGKVPAVKVWEDEDYLAFLDMNPVVQGHTLLMPKRHNDYVFDLQDPLYTKLMLKVKSLAKFLKSKLNPKRVGIIIEGFGVPHIHVHLMPINTPHEINQKGKPNVSKEELKKVAKKIAG